MLKWPNDLMLAMPKLAGILLERSGDRVVVGFGVNLAVSARKLPGRDAAALERSAPASGLCAACSPEASPGCSACGAVRRPEAFARPGWSGPIRSERRLSVHSGGGEKLSGHFRRLGAGRGLRLRSTTASSR